MARKKRTYHKRHRLRQLRAFCSAARLGSIGKAAERLGVHPESVSAQLRGLENELDTILFDRSSSGVVLNRAGKRLLKITERLVRGMDELPVELAKPYEPADQDHIQCAAGGLGASYVLPPYVRRFRNSYPNVRIQVNNRSQHEALNLLQRRKVEFALGADIPHPDSTLQYHHVFPYRSVLITSMDHPLAGRSSITPEEVGDWTMIKPAAGMYSRELREAIGRTFGLNFKSVIEVGGWEALKRFVACGLGVSVVPSFGILETDRVTLIPLDAYFPAQSFGVFTQRGRGLSAPALQFLRLMISDFPDPLPALPADW